MRTALVATLLAGFLGGSFVAARALSESAPAETESNATQQERGAPESEASGRLVVHEWGTFTSFSGSDGVKLEFRPLVDVDLPAFVLDRGRQAGMANLLAKQSIRVLQRMETPVTYFYTDRERDVRVRVGFPEGLLTEFYPPVDSMKPEFQWGEQKQQTIADSELDWGTVHLIPADRLQTDVRTPELARRVEHALLRSLLPGTRPLVDTTLPPGVAPLTVSESQTHYLHARETDSALVHVRHEPDPKQPRRPSGDYFEKFLFYRGVGNFDLPLELQARGEGEFVLRNTGPDPVRRLFLVTVDGDDVRYTTHDAIAPGTELTLREGGRTRTVDSLERDVQAALVDAGLFEKEARAMVATWRDSWFGEQGTRLFYLLPQRLTDGLLPLHVDPRPDETVRIMVGRLEIMSPEAEARAVKLVRQSAERRRILKARPEEERKEFPVTAETTVGPLADELGRLLEPALVRVRHTTQDPGARAEASLLLQELQEYHQSRTPPEAGSPASD